MNKKQTGEVQYEKVVGTHDKKEIREYGGNIHFFRLRKQIKLRGMGETFSIHCCRCTLMLGCTDVAVLVNPCFTT